MGKFIDMTGQRFGRLTVIDRAGTANNGGVRWRCRCDCGKVVCVKGSSLRSGSTKSCGCYRKYVLNSSLKTRIQETCDGHSSSRLYIIWQQMKMRCDNPKNTKYARYGGRGIKVCPAWYDWEIFRSWAVNAGYQDNLTIDRIDVNGNYEPSNCRWVDVFTQANNTTRNVYLTFDGETHTISEWARLTGNSVSTLNSRFRYGWTVKRALTEPVRQYKRRNK